MSKLLAYTIGGQKIGIDIKTWNTIMLSGNTAFIVIADTGSTPSNYTNISSVDNWNSFGNSAGLTDVQVKTEIVKLIPNIPTADQYAILANYMNVGINTMTKIGTSVSLGNIVTGSTYLTGVKDIKLNITGSTATGNTTINGNIISKVVSGSTSVISPNICATTSFYEGGTALSAKYALKANAITGATNLGTGNGTIFTSVSGNKINLKSLSGGTNVTITCNGNYIAINAPSAAGATWTGSTANGVGTYASSTKICSNPNMTFNGSSLSIVGNILASTYVCSPVITGSTRVCSPIVCGTSCISTALLCSTGVVKGTILTGSTRVCSPTICATTSAFAPTPAGNNNSTCVATTAWYFGQSGNTAPVMDGSALIGTSPRWAHADHVHPSDTIKLNVTTFSTYTGTTVPNTYYNKTQINSYTASTLTNINSRVLKAGDTMTGKLTINNALSVSGIISGNTCVTTPIIIGTTCSNSPLHCGACVYATTIVCSPIISGSTKVCSPIICGTSCVVSPLICGTTKVQSPIITGSTCVTSPTVCAGTCLCSVGTTRLVGGATAASFLNVSGATKIVGITQCEIVFANQTTGALTGNTNFVYNVTGCTLCVPYIKTTGGGSYLYQESTSNITNATSTCKIYMSGTPWTFQEGTYRVDINVNAGNGSSNGCTLVRVTCNGRASANSIHGSDYLLRSQTANFGFSVAVSRDMTFTAGCNCLIVQFWQSGTGTACVTYASIRAARIC